MFSLILIVPIILIIVILLIIAGVKATSSKKGGEDMIKTVYVYLVLFATLMMTIGGSVSAFMAIADIASPTGYYQSFEEYKMYGHKTPVAEGQGDTELSEEELLERYNAMVATEQARQVNRAVNSLIKSLGWIIVPLPIFIYYQKRIPKRETEKTE